MKKKYSSLFASVLAVAMLFTLAACGAPGSQGGTPSSQGDAVPEFVYVPSFREVKNEDNQAIGAACFTDEGFYTTPSELVGRRAPRAGEDEEYPGQFDIYAEKLLFVGYDGKTTQMENYEPFVFTPEEGHDGYGSMYRLAADGARGLAALYHTEESWNDAPDGMDYEDPQYWEYSHYEPNWYLRTMDATGRELSMQRIELSPDDWYVPYGLLYHDGRILVAGTDGLRIFDQNGGEITKIGMEGYIQSLVTLSDGTPCMVFYDTATDEMKLGAIDPSSGRITKTWKCPRNAYEFKSGGGDYDLYYQSGINVYGYSLESESGEKLFDWLNEDVPQSALSGFSVLPDGRIFALTNTWDSKWENVTTEFVTLEKKSYADVPQKKTLTLAFYGDDYDLENAVIRFNRSSDVRIRAIDYAQYNDYESEDGWDAGLTRLRTEIMAGTMPDIIALDGLPYRQMAAKGLLEDLYPYMEKDSEVNRADFLPNVLQAMEVGGKLYSSVSRFTVVTLAGASSIVGTEPGWSVDELRAALATMPQGCDVLDQFTTSGDILRDELTIDSDFYIDWATGKVNFDSKEFVDLLYFAKLFPDSFSWDDYDWEEDMNTNRILSGKQMLLRMSLYGFEDIAQQEAEFGGDMTYIGFPSASGTGSYFNIMSGYGISSSCSDKEAAWQFVRSFMTPKAIENASYYWGFPANSKLLEKKLQEAMTVEYKKDENGQYLKDDNGEKIPIAITYIWYSDKQEAEPVYALTRAQADKVMVLINSTDKLYLEDTATLDIIFEQLDAFLTGQKTAEEVARLVQGKMNIYVNEQR